MQAINPATGKVIQEYARHTSDEIDEKLGVAAATFAAWRQTPLETRSSMMKRAALHLVEQEPELSRLMTLEMGKPINASRAEVQKCAWACTHYADHASLYLAPEVVETDASRSYVRYDPLGPVLAVMPWNFPLWQVFRFAAPALMAGNVALLKHASNVPGCALAIENIFQEASFPKGVFSTLLVGSGEVDGIIRDPCIAAVTLTGSEPAGSSVASCAGGALKKTVLELGGSDPFIVLADADPEAVARQAVQARIINNGESCIAAKRFIVEAPIADAFEEAMAAALQKLKVGDPLDPATELGPLAREDLREELHDQVQRTVSDGARLICGGEPLPGPGYFYPPTLLVDVEPAMAAFEEETFGPLAAVSRARNSVHAIELANQSSLGLGASIWSGDPERAERLAPRIEAGAVFINDIVKSDPRLPFGGIKRSGYGRELGREGIREFVNIKTVWIR